MRPTSNRRRRQQSRRGDHGGEEGGGGAERWLLTYADMITLLLALFVVLFSISAVNVSKFKTLKETLEQAFSPHILSGGGSIIPNGGSEATKEKATAAIAALHAERASAAQTAAEQEQFRALKHKLDEYAREHGFANQIETVINQRGLVIRLLTDRVLFDSGSAANRSPGCAFWPRSVTPVTCTFGTVAPSEGTARTCSASCPSAWPTGWLGRRFMAMTQYRPGFGR